MTIPKIAESGWLDLVIDHLRQALKAAEDSASDLAKMRRCDAAGCGRMFDATDPRAREVKQGRITYNFCPGCETEHGLNAASAKIERLKRDLGNAMAAGD